MKTHPFRTVAICFIVSSFLFACGSKKESQSASEDFQASKSQVSEDIGIVIRDLPPPSEVPYLLMSVGADYNGSLINTLEDDYVNDQTKSALNLGVYTADIGYLSAYEKAQESLEYLNACKDLAKSLGLGTLMDLRMLERFDANLANKDSLRVLVDEMMEKTGDRLRALNRMNIAGLVLCGGYIEGLYLATSVIDTYPDELPEEVRNLVLEPLIKKVIDQSNSLKDLFKVLDDFPEDAEIRRMKSELSKLKEIYDSELAEISTSISENTGDLVLTASVLDNLTAEITRIRSTIIQ